MLCQDCGSIFPGDIRAHFCRECKLKRQRMHVKRSRQKVGLMYTDSQAEWYRTPMKRVFDLLTLKQEEPLPVVFSLDRQGRVSVIMVEGADGHNLGATFQTLSRKLGSVEIVFAASVYMNRDNSLRPSSDPHAKEGALFVWLTSDKAQMWFAEYELSSKGKPMNVKEWKPLPYDTHFVLRNTE